MKFEIDDKTGMITTPLDFSGNETEYTESFMLEQILQAVKKTQEKLVNKQIQEIQDSKNIPLPEIINPIELQKYVKEELKRHEKIDQNQKIVDEIIKFYNSQKDNVTDLDGMNFLGSIIKNATGKDIKDL